MRQLHILIAAHAWYGDVIGGAFRLATEFAEHLANSGHRVTYLCCAADSATDFAPRERILGVDVRRYSPAAKTASGIARLKYHITESARIANTLSNECPIDVLNGHSPLQFYGAQKALRKFSLHRIYTVHSPFDDELSSSSRRKGWSSQMAVWIARWIEGRNVRCTDRIQTDSRYTLDVMKAKHGQPVFERGIVAPGWVDMARFPQHPDKRTLRQNLGGVWNTSIPVFFTMRRLENRMGLETLIAAAGTLATQGYPFRVLIGGGGSLTQHLANLILESGLEEYVFLLGRVPEEQVPSAYAAADCFVLPSKLLECFGLIVIEAFAAGTPVIASRVAAIPEIAARQGEDWLFDPGDANELAAKMKSFLAQELKVSRDLPEIAREYDKRRILEQWSQLALPEDSLAEPAPILPARA